MITLAQYFGAFDHDEWERMNAETLLERVNPLLIHSGHTVVNPKTGSQISGERFGGFRPQSCPIGASRSAHKTGEAVDVYDPRGALDSFLSDAILRDYDLYREHPDDTPGWCHLTTRAPKSGRRTFKP